MHMQLQSEVAEPSKTCKNQNGAAYRNKGEKGGTNGNDYGGEQREWWKA